MQSIPYSRLARMLTGNYQWGKINTTYKTNQIYTYYFSCEWHGWLIIAYDTLSAYQKIKINNFYNWEDKIQFDYVAYDTLTDRAKANSRYTNPSERLHNVRFISLEEDSEWAIAYSILWIAKESFLELPEEKREEYSKNAMQSYYNPDTHEYRYI